MCRFVVEIVMLFFFCLNATGSVYNDQHNSSHIDAVSIENFFDDYLKPKMSENNVAGAVIAVVKDTKILVKKGYGFADINQKKLVDPDKSVFTLGSLSKIFTWTAVMQLVEQGKIDLDADINRYLDFQIPETFPEPITMNHLMSHSSGFDDNKFEQMVPTYKTLVPLGTWLKKQYQPG